MKNIECGAQGKHISTTYTPYTTFSQAFTLIEVMITLGIFLLVSTVGVVVGIDSYQRVNFRSDVATAASLLQKARSSAMSNVGESKHGVYFDGDDFTLFQGNNYASRDASRDVIVEHNDAISVTGEVVFTQLSGAASGSPTITLTDGVRTAVIDINTDGGINW